MSTSRDFRINAQSVQAAIEAQEESEDEEEDPEEQETMVCQILCHIIEFWDSALCAKTTKLSSLISTTSIHFILSKFDHWYKLYGGCHANLVNDGNSAGLVLLVWFLSECNLKPLPVEAYSMRNCVDITFISCIDV